MWWSDDKNIERRERLRREIANRQKKGEPFVSLEAPQGSSNLSKTFWGQAWCRNLESYQEYENRLPRGRSYLRQGNVYDLTIEPGRVHAIVAGSELYDTEVVIHQLSKERWAEIVSASSGQVSSLLDLLAGKLGDGLMRVLTDKDHGLFPKPKELYFDCSCPDYADVCKHVSAVLYGVGVLLDKQPELLFTLRGVDQAELLSSASTDTASGMAAGSGSGDLANANLSALFGINLADSTTDLPPSPPNRLRE